MPKTTSLRVEFVDSFPDQLADSTLYVSIMFATAAHQCCCGCGLQVITPFSPADWRLIFEGKFVSLEPSIGNWSFPCKSHYWITRNTVDWAKPYSKQQIQATRELDARVKDEYLATVRSANTASPAPVIPVPHTPPPSNTSVDSWWFKFKRWWHGNV